MKKTDNVRLRSSNSGLTRSFRKFNYSRLGTQLQAETPPPDTDAPPRLRSEWLMKSK